MSKNILVLIGSPRKNGNSDLLAGAFAEGARAGGHTVTLFNATKNVGGCKACDTCWSKGHPCSFRDGFADLEPLLEQADAVVFATPLYWFGFSSQIKAAIDRTYAYLSPNAGRKLHIRESALLVCAGDAETHVFDGIIRTYEIMLHYLNWNNAGVLAVPAVHAKGDIRKTDALEKARNFSAGF